MAFSRKKTKPVVPAGIQSTTCGCGDRVPQRSSGLLAAERKANELVSSGGSLGPKNRRPHPGDGSAFLPACASAVTGELAAACSRQLVSPEAGVTYAAV